MASATRKCIRRFHDSAVNVKADAVTGESTDNWMMWVGAAGAGMAVGVGATCGELPLPHVQATNAAMRNERFITTSPQPH
jgi:hypothetical protein